MADGNLSIRTALDHNAQLEFRRPKAAAVHTEGGYHQRSRLSIPVPHFLALFCKNRPPHGPFDDSAPQPLVGTDGQGSNLRARGTQEVITVGMSC